MHIYLTFHKATKNMLFMASRVCLHYREASLIYRIGKRIDLGRKDIVEYDCNCGGSNTSSRIYQGLGDTVC